MRGDGTLGRWLAGRARPDAARELVDLFGLADPSGGPPAAALAWARTTLLAADLDPEQDRAAAIGVLRAGKGLSAGAAATLVHELAHGW